MFQGLYIPMLIKHWVRAIPGIGHGFGWGDVFRQGNFLSGLAVLVPSFWRMWMLHHNLHYIYAAAAAAKSFQSCPTLCDPIDGSPPGSPIPGILQARTLEWVAISFSNAWKWKVKSESEVAQSCPTPSDSMDCSLPGSSLHGIFQARVLEWGAIAFSTLHIYSSLKDKFRIESKVIYL